LSDVPLPLDTGDFRLIDRKIIEQFRKLNEKNRYIRGLISWLGFKQIPFYYSRDPRFGGETKYSITKMLKLAGTGLQYFSKKPLRIAISIGFFSIFVGIMLAIWVIAAKLSNTIETVTGWTSMLIVVIFFGGVQLLTIGVLGSYIGSIFDEVKNRPEYVIARKINFED
jgi:dolichol-phosphate mannosyltransferase